MKIVLAAVSSLDGKLTRGYETDILKWTSPEDAEHFARLKAGHSLVVMGRRTYEAMRGSLQLSDSILRIVLTSQPENFKPEEIGGQLEFSDEPPIALVNRLEAQGYSNMLLVGGGQINAQFLAAELVDEIYLSLEPVLFGNGTNFADGIQLDTELTLISMEKLNSRGTLLMHYKTKDKS